MSNGERIAQVAHDKWATVSNSLRSLLINEQMSHALKIFWQKISEILFFSMFYTGFFILKNERFAHYLIFGEWCMQIAQFTHQKWAMWANHSGRSQKMSDVSKSLRSLTKNERPWPIHSGCSPKMSEWANHLFFWVNCSFTLFFAKNKQFDSRPW